MSQESTKNHHIPPVTKRLGFFVVLLISGFVIFHSVNWIYDRISGRLGTEIAEVVVAFLTVLIVLLVLFGFWVGFQTDRVLHQRQIRALWIYRSLKRSRVLRSLWRNVDADRQTDSAKPAVQELISIPVHAPRRGRRPTHSLDRWIRVVHAWENRDIHRNTMTLCEYLSEQFGTYADGSPMMSENSYYEWRKKVLKELGTKESRKKQKATA